MDFIRYISLLVVTLPFVLTKESMITLNKEISAANPMILTCGEVTTFKNNDTVLWTYTNLKNMSKVLMEGSSTVNITDGKAYGDYVCTVNDDVISSHVAAILVPPIIQNTRNTITYSDGDNNRKITCLSDGSFPPPEFLWLRRGELKDEAPVIVSPDTNINVNITNTWNSSTLMFYNVTYDIQGTYICRVSNMAGNATTELQIRVKDKYAAVWPFLGIVTEVVLLISIIFLYERHSKKSVIVDDPLEKSDDEKPLKCDDSSEMQSRNNNK